MHDYSVSEELYHATDLELMTLLGAASLGALPAGALLDVGRAGELNPPRPAHMGDGGFGSNWFVERGRQFLKIWAKDLCKALCQNSTSKTKRPTAKSRDEFTTLAAGLAATIAHAVPSLAPFTGVVTVLGVLVAKSGMSAFCKMLLEMEHDGKGPGKIT